jgi:hypothetical protein
MRTFVAVAVLGTTLAFGAGAAFASDTVDYQGPYQPVKIVSSGSGTESDHSMVAGDGGTTPGVYQQLREENFGH